MVNLYTDPNKPVTQADSAGTIPGQSLDRDSGASTGLSDHWDTFISHPENRAGLMQFAVNMLSGRGLGASLGGFGEAAGANVAAQEAEAKALDEGAIKERE